MATFESTLPQPEPPLLELQTKIKRQITILGIAIQNTDNLKPVDLAEMFNCEELTIKRDLQELRSAGFDIHSEKGCGVCFNSWPAPKMLKEMILQYYGLCYSETAVDKATALLVKQLKEKSLGFFVSLQRCIDDNRVVVIDYIKQEGEKELNREIEPLLIFQSEGYYRVLARHEQSFKQYHLNKLTRVKPTTRKFKRVPQEEIDQLFTGSFRSWIGTERHTVRLLLSKTWAERLKPRQLMESQLVTENRDGSVVYEMTVNSLTEIASWVVSRGEGVTVLEPKELREMVIGIAKGTAANYK